MHIGPSYILVMNLALGKLYCDLKMYLLRRLWRFKHLSEFKVITV